jgi:ribosomal protein S26
MSKADNQANELYKKQGQSVVCVYCGKLMPKNKAGVVYNIGENRLEYSHDSCFESNEKHGTLEDLLTQK